MQTLRPYQQNAVNRVRELYAEGTKRVLVVAPTGSGKTTLFSELVKRARAARMTVLVVAHRTELISQASERLSQFGVPHGTIAAGHKRGSVSELVQVASVQTLARRAKPAAQLIVLDEAHRARAATWESVLSLYPNAWVLGVTASPWRLDGKGLGDIFHKSVLVGTPRDMVKEGFLCPLTGFAFDQPDLRAVEKTRGDFNETQLVTAMSKSKIIGNIVEQWKRTASSLSTVLFAVSIDHSKKMVAEFQAVGVRAEHVDGTMSRGERKATIARLNSGETQIVSNVSVFTEGFDCPRLKCAILARPTLSLALYLQMVGRVRRPWEGITARVHDHSGNVLRHGLPDADRDYSLTASVQRKKKDAGPSVRQCKECYALYDPADNHEGCPVCGALSGTGPRSGPEFVADGTMLSFDDLVFEEAKPVKTFAQGTPAERKAYYQRKLDEAKATGRKPGWAYYQHLAKYGCAP